MPKLVKMSEEEEKNGRRKACKYLVKVEGYSYREAERIMSMTVRSGNGVYEFVHDRR